MNMKWTYYDKYHIWYYQENEHATAFGSVGMFQDMYAFSIPSFKIHAYSKTREDAKKVVETLYHWLADATSEGYIK
jgi:hypothetical protein